MNYDNHPDFNKARTAEESTKRFAADRERTFIKATDDFGAGFKYALMWLPIVGLLYLGLAPSILG